jgi:hypothetical protein
LGVLVAENEDKNLSRAWWQANPPNGAGIMMKIRYLLCALILMLALSACSTAQVTPQKSGPTAPAPKSGTTAVTGRVLSSKTGLPLVEEPVRLAEVFYDDGVPLFLLDAAFSPATLSDANGYFAFNDIEPKEYVLTVGEFFATWAPHKEGGEAKVFKLEADQVIDVGEIKVDIGK